MDGGHAPRNRASRPGPAVLRPWQSASLNEAARLCPHATDFSAPRRAGRLQRPLRRPGSPHDLRAPCGEIHIMRRDHQRVTTARQFAKRRAEGAASGKDRARRWAHPSAGAWDRAPALERSRRVAPRRRKSASDTRLPGEPRLQAICSNSCAVDLARSAGQPSEVRESAPASRSRSP